MDLACFGPYRGISGYDFLTRGFLKEWHNQGHQIALSEFKEWSNCRANTDIDPIIEQFEKNTQTLAPSTFLNFCLIDQSKLNLFGKNACYTMFEADRIPKVWVDSSEKLDLLIVPSEFSRTAFINSGISDKKVFTCPVPLDIEKIKAQTPLPLYDFNHNSLLKYKHRFLNCSEYLGRKNVDMLIRAWCDETKETDDACLILKLNSNSGIRLDFFQKKINDLISKRACAPIYLITDFLPETKMLSLYHSCTHYISTSYGEGWGLSESICGILGKTLIVPFSSSFKDYLDQDSAYLILTQTVGASQDGPVGHYYQGAKWSAPIFYSVRKNIRKALTENLNKGANAAKRLEKLCDSRTVAPLLLDIINDFKPGRTILPTAVKSEADYNFLMICKSLGGKCGIADYSMSLFKGIQSDENKKKFSEAMLVRGESVEYTSVLDHNNLHITNLQLEYQFISPIRLKLYLEYHKNTKMIPTVTLHTVNVAAWEYHQILIDHDVDIIVSSHLMRKVATERCGFKTNKVHVIPMGISSEGVITPEPRADGPFRIGFSGFCYPHKGIDKLIQYMNLHGDDKQCLIFSSKPENDSQGNFEKVHDYHTKHNNNTQWVTEFLDEKDIITGLSTCDLIFLPYSEYGGVGVSAAIRTCIKAGVPIVAFDNTFFRDCVYDEGLVTFLSKDKLNKFSAWSEELNDAINQIKTDPTIKSNYIINRDKFVAKYNWNQIGNEYLSHFQDLVREAHKPAPKVVEA